VAGLAGLSAPMFVAAAVTLLAVVLVLQFHLGDGP
jgi:hypothetical protein